LDWRVVLEITAIQDTNPITYKNKYTNNEVIQGNFYEQELQKSNQDTFLIEKLLKTKGSRLFVKWLGYPNTFNSWIDKFDVVPLK
jgi:hypothetical protein